VVRPVKTRHERADNAPIERAVNAPPTRRQRVVYNKPKKTVESSYPPPKNKARVKSPHLKNIQLSAACDL
jgi:hypothetical protein